MKNKRIKGLWLIIIASALFGGICGAARLVPPRIDYSNIRIDAEAMPQKIASAYIKAAGDGLYVMMAYDNVAASIFERNRIGAYIIHLNHSMQITATYHYPWRTVVFFKPIGDTRMLLWSGKKGDIRIYDRAGNLQREYNSMVTKDYGAMVDGGLSIEESQENARESTAPDGTIYRIMHGGRPLLIARKEPDGTETVFNLQEAFNTYIEKNQAQSSDGRARRPSDCFASGLRIPFIGWYKRDIGRQKTEL